MPTGAGDHRRYVDPRKITDYLLSTASVKSRSRHKFLSSFGFDPVAPDILRTSLLEHAVTGVSVARRSDAYGEHCMVHGPLASPDGRDPTVTTVWTKSEGEDFWHFVTLLPK